MKMIFRYMAIAMAAGAALLSCSKEMTPENGGGTGTGEARVISVSFGDQTKSQLVGVSPEFKAGDVILFSNGNAAPQQCTVVIDGSGNATVTTTLTGRLKAVYPADAAVVSGNDITGVRIDPNLQDGSFAKANIAMAENVTFRAKFHNKTAILKFYVDATIGVTGIVVTGTGIADGANFISISTPAGKTSLADVADDGKHRICFIAVKPGAYTDLSYFTVTSTQNTVSKAAFSATLTENKIYKAFLPYYIKIKVSSSPDVYQRWAYCNLGAFLPEEPGKYFAWGDIEGQTWNGSSWSGEGFSTAPDVGSPVPTEIPLQYDAAYNNWGSTWRIPTSAECSTLISGTGTTTSDFINTAEKKGLQIHGTALFFPAAGYGNGDNLKNNDGNGTQGDYWSSTIGTTTSTAYQLYFFFGATTTPGQAIYSSFCNTNCHRRLGESIRPIYDNSWVMEDYDDGGDI